MFEMVKCGEQIENRNISIIRTIPRNENSQDVCNDIYGIKKNNVDNGDDDNNIDNNIINSYDDYIIYHLNDDVNGNVNIDNIYNDTTKKSEINIDSKRRSSKMKETLIQNKSPKSSKNRTSPSSCFLSSTLPPKKDRLNRTITDSNSYENNESSKSNKSNNVANDYNDSSCFETVEDDMKVSVRDVPNILVTRSKSNSPSYFSSKLLLHITPSTTSSSTVSKQLLSL